MDNQVYQRYLKEYRRLTPDSQQYLQSIAETALLDSGHLHIDMNDVMYRVISLIREFNGDVRMLIQALGDNKYDF